MNPNEEGNNEEVLNEAEEMELEESSEIEKSEEVSQPSNEIITFLIKKGKKTVGHPASLKKLGFEPTESDDKTHIEVKAKRLTLAEPIDIRTHEGVAAFGKHCRDNGEMADYKTKFTATKADGEETEVTSILACTFLGEFSCLVGKTSKPSAKKVGPSIDDLV